MKEREGSEVSQALTAASAKAPDDDEKMLGVRNCRRAPLYLRVPRSENSEGNFSRPLCSATVGERLQIVCGRLPANTRHRTSQSESSEID